MYIIFILEPIVDKPLNDACFSCAAISQQYNFEGSLSDSGGRDWHGV